MSAATVEGRKLSNLQKINLTKFRERIRKALIANDGIVVQAAKELGIGQRQLWRWLKKDPTLLEGTGHVGNPSKAPAS